MRIGYLDCMSGISGDMTLAALIDCGVPHETIQRGIDSLNLPSCRLEVREVKKHGFRAVKVDVLHEPEHAHRHLHHIDKLIDSSSELSARQKQLAKQIFLRIGQAEAKVHGTTLEKVHFHEVGAVDSIADIVGCAIGWDVLAVDRIVCSPIPTGTGFVRIAHGRVSVPAPATAELLAGIPLAASDVEAELTTPTGAGIAASLSDAFGPLPAMTIDRIGYGAGTRDLADQANLLRLIVGDVSDHGGADQAWMMETNLDDTTPEQIGHCQTKLLESGALDVYTTPIQMKKNRPGQLLSVICRGADCDRLERIVFRETSTLGVRRWAVSRHKLPRRAARVDTTQFGSIDGKVALLDGVERFSPEFESCRDAAERHGVGLPEVMQAAQQAFRPGGDAAQ